MKPSPELHSQCEAAFFFRMHSSSMQAREPPQKINHCPLSWRRMILAAAASDLLPINLPRGLKKPHKLPNNSSATHCKFWDACGWWLGFLPYVVAPTCKWVIVCMVPRGVGRWRFRGSSASCRSENYKLNDLHKGDGMQNDPIKDIKKYTFVAAVGPVGLLYRCAHQLRSANITPLCKLHVCSHADVSHITVILTRFYICYPTHS